jgi:hypothetical protein
MAGIEDGTPVLDAAEDADASDESSLLMQLATRFGLTRFERCVLLLAAAMEFDTRIPTLCAQAQHTSSRPFPTFALALALFDDPLWDALCPERPLRYWRMIEITQSGTQPLTASPLRADERIVNYLKGLNHVDERLRALLMPFPENGADRLPPSQQLQSRGVVHAVRESGLNLVQLLGRHSADKQVITAAAARELGLELKRLPAELLPQQPTDIETFMRLLERESSLVNLGLYVDSFDRQGADPVAAYAPALNRLLAHDAGVVFLATREPWPMLDRESAQISIARSTRAEQRQTWQALLPADESPLAAGLSAQFDLDTRRIETIVRTGSTDASGIWQACLTAATPRLEMLAEYIDCGATWHDLVLPAAETELLRALVTQVRHRATVYDEWGFRVRMNRGLGITALFAGESGTGKTMAAEVIANDLRLNLYRIDLSTVVSKYIGETEKNLRRVFDSAEDGGAILFFDEADALFGKRSEVKDSHDRYANIEINYLLQRMEAFSGLAILATNLKSSLDRSFQRRLRFIVDFPFPGFEERRTMWERIFPSETPVDRLDLDWLARFVLTGGSIHNIALHAAFLAAEAGSAVTMSLVLDAARVEFRKLERPINETEFR